MNDERIEMTAIEREKKRVQRERYRIEVQHILRKTSTRQAQPTQSTDTIPADMEIQSYQLLDYLGHAAETRRLENQYFEGSPEPAKIYVRKLQEAEARAYLLEERVIHADSKKAIAEAVADKLLIIRHEYERNEDRAMHHERERRRNEQLSDLADALISRTLDALGMETMQDLAESDSESGFIRKKIRQHLIYGKK
jgi:hypothetical protein